MLRACWECCPYQTSNPDPDEGVEWSGCVDVGVGLGEEGAFTVRIWHQGLFIRSSDTCIAANVN